MMTHRESTCKLGKNVDKPNVRLARSTIRLFPTEIARSDREEVTDLLAHIC